MKSNYLPVVLVGRCQRYILVKYNHTIVCDGSGVGLLLKYHVWHFGSDLHLYFVTKILPYV